MSQDNTLVDQVNAFRMTVINMALENEYPFDVTFTALSHAVGALLFDYLLTTQGELTEENVKNAVFKFCKHTLDNANGAMAAVQALQEEQEPESRIIVQD